MAFRALLFSKSPETNAAITVACKVTGIRVEICSDIFTAIEKGKTQAFSCVIADWADQPEASFLLKRARESASNQNTVAIAIVDNEPTAADMRDNRLDFLVYRPVSAQEAEAVLSKACEKMQPASAADVTEPPEEDNTPSRAAIPDADEPGSTEQPQPEGFSESLAAEENNPAEITGDDGTEEPHHYSRSVSFAGVCAVALTLAAVFCLWRARDTIVYLSRTPEGKMQVLRESVAALFYQNPSAALPVGSVASDTHDDAYFSRVPAAPESQTAALQVVATESTLPDSHMPLSKAADLPLPAPVLAPQESAPVRVERAAIPQSMRDSPPIAPPVVVTVSPAQMMPVSAPQTQPIPQPTSEPVTISEETARALLIHTVNPAYPPEALAQKLHGAVVLQALVGRDGSIQDLKIVRGYFVLGRAAIAAVKQWRFQPYTLDGHAASTQTLITINFTYPPG